MVLNWPNGSGGGIDPGGASGVPGEVAPSSMVVLAPGVGVPQRALRFAFSASSGPGGQNVNKRATKAELRVSLQETGLPRAVVERLCRLAPHLVTEGGELIIECDASRSQERNKAECVERLGDLVTLALMPPKPRKATRPTRSSRARRVDEKKRRGRTKQRRRGEWE